MILRGSALAGRHTASFAHIQSINDTTDDPVVHQYFVPKPVGPSWLVLLHTGSSGLESP